MYPSTSITCFHTKMMPTSVYQYHEELWSLLSVSIAFFQSSCERASWKILWTEIEENAWSNQEYREGHKVKSNKIRDCWGKTCTLTFLLSDGDLKIIRIHWLKIRFWNRLRRLVFLLPYCLIDSLRPLPSVSSMLSKKVSPDETVKGKNTWVTCIGCPQWNPSMDVLFKQSKELFQTLCNWLNNRRSTTSITHNVPFKMYDGFVLIKQYTFESSFFLIGFGNNYI